MNCITLYCIFVITGKYRTMPICKIIKTFSLNTQEVTDVVKFSYEEVDNSGTSLAVVSHKLIILITDKLIGLSEMLGLPISLGIVGALYVSFHF